jgi:hypothetical protein
VIAALLALAVALPPVGAEFDYQIGGAYPLPAGVTVVSRDWRDRPAGDYAVCYVNAFQSQPGEHWPRSLVLPLEDPDWPGEFAIDFSTGRTRARAARHVERRVRRCAAKGFRAVEYDNLDAWTRYPQAPFGRADTIAYARRLVRVAHRHGLAAAQKNTVELNGPRLVGFDFAIAEECGRWRECGRYERMYGQHVLAVEYRRRDLRRTCRVFRSAVLRDLDVSRPGAPGYRFARC